MRTHARKPRASREAAETGSDQAERERGPHAQAARLGNQAVGKLLRSANRERAVDTHDRLENRTVLEFVGNETAVENFGQSARHNPAEREAERVAAAVGRSARQPPTGIPAIRRSRQTPAEERSGDDGTGPHREAAIGAGEPLRESTRRYFETVFDADLSSVRIHTGLKAWQAADSIGARAFAEGSDVVLARGEYRPGSPEGLALLAHELVHVIQQTRGESETAIQRVERDDAERRDPGQEERSTGQQESKPAKQRDRRSRIEALYMDSERELEMIGIIRRIEQTAEDVDYGMDGGVVEQWHQQELALREFMNAAVERDRLESRRDDRQWLQSEWIVDEWNDVLATVSAYRKLAADSVKRDLADVIEDLQKRLESHHERYMGLVRTIEEHRDIGLTGQRINLYIDVLEFLGGVGNLGPQLASAMRDPRRLTLALINQVIHEMRREMDVIQSSVDVLTSYYQRVELRGKSIAQVVDEMEIALERMLDAAETLRWRKSQYRQAEFVSAISESNPPR